MVPIGDGALVTKLALEELVEAKLGREPVGMPAANCLNDFGKRARLLRIRSNFTNGLS